MSQRNPETPSRLDPEPTPRRDFLGLAALTSAGCAACVALLGILRLPRAAVLPSPSKTFSFPLPENWAPGSPLEVPGRNVVVFRDAEGVYALSKVCTHLGCIVKPDSEGFHCPCHGSRFSSEGLVTRGPAPGPLPWVRVTSQGDGVLLIDEGSSVLPGTKVAV